jgi:ribosomal protein L37AE/L43A
MRIPFRKPKYETPEQVEAQLDDMTEKYRTLQCKRNGHRPSWNSRFGVWECAECGKVLPPPDSSEGGR